MRNWRNYRNLAIIYGVALVVWIGEYRRRMKEEDVFVAPDSRYAQVASELYPDRCEPEFYQGFRVQRPAELELTQQAQGTDPLHVEQLVAEYQKKLKIAAEHYQRSIQGGLVSREELFYYHAVSLIYLRADAAQIDQAIAAWRRNYPYSRREDLAKVRQAIDANFQRLTKQVEEIRQRKELEQQQAAIEAAYGNSPRPKGAPSGQP